jgi:hypothetical protein
MSATISRAFNDLNVQGSPQANLFLLFQLPQEAHLAAGVHVPHIIVNDGTGIIFKLNMLSNISAEFETVLARIFCCLTV